mmetsp:Transcript_20835/g.52575  ORF Transcript_20835/g.52575 Transcript_20835/m.52575 type:complete len:256 (+) Transcript_20835:1269-2036(+)
MILSSLDRWLNLMRLRHLSFSWIPVRFFRMSYSGSRKMTCHAPTPCRCTPRRRDSSSCALQGTYARPCPDRSSPGLPEVLRSASECCCASCWCCSSSRCVPAVHPPGSGLLRLAPANKALEYGETCTIVAGEPLLSGLDRRAAPVVASSNGSAASTDDFSANRFAASNERGAAGATGPVGTGKPVWPERRAALGSAMVASRACILGAQGAPPLPGVRLLRSGTVRSMQVRPLGPRREAFGMRGCREAALNDGSAG